MTPEQTHYGWERLARAIARPASEAQRKDLVADLVSQQPGKPLTDALTAFISGTLTQGQAVAGFKAARIDGFDIAAYRKSLAPPPDELRTAEAALNAQLA